MSGKFALMPARERKFPKADALGQAVGEAGDGFFSVKRDKLLKRREQSGVRKTGSLDSGHDRFGESLGDKTERRLPFVGGGRVFQSWGSFFVHG
jgi:hypothetical protein